MCNNCKYYSFISEAELYGCDTRMGAGKDIPCCTFNNNEHPINDIILDCSKFEPIQF